MKLLFIVTAVFAAVACAYAASVATSDTVPDKWISVETGMTLADGNNVTLSKRAGTEVVTCYGFGTKIDRAPAITVIDDWCDNVAIGKGVPVGATLWARYNYGTFTILVSAFALSNPSCNGFIIDGNCNRLLRLPLDGCNTGGVNGKQGGYETDSVGNGASIQARTVVTSNSGVVISLVGSIGMFKEPVKL